MHRISMERAQIGDHIGVEDRHGEMHSITLNRRRVLAAFLPVSAALLVIGEALTPKGLDQPITSQTTALSMLSIAAAHTNQVYFSNLVVIFGIAALGVSYAAIATLVRDRGATFATAAALLGGFSFCSGIIANVLVGFNLAATVTARVPREVAARYLVATFASPAGKVILVGYFGGVAVATILMAIALWRSRCLPHWLLALFVIGIAMGATAPAGLVSIPLQLPFAAAMVILSSRIWQMPALPAGRNPALSTLA